MPGMFCTEAEPPESAESVSGAYVLSGPPELRKAALESVLQWRFRNASAGKTQKKGGRPRMMKSKHSRRFAAGSSRVVLLYWRPLDLKYLLGAPGVGTLSVTCAPLTCGLVNAVVRVMPVPEICAPAACAKVSGGAMVMVAPPAPPPPRPIPTTTADSEFAPLSIVMV